MFIEYAIRVGPTNASFRHSNGVLQQHGAAGCYEQHACIRQLPTCFTQFSHFIYSYATGIRNTADSAPLATSLTSATIACLSEDLKPLALLLDVCQRKSLEPLHSSKRRERLNYGEQKQARYKRIILAFCHRLRRGLSFLRTPAVFDGGLDRPGSNEQIFLSVAIQLVATLASFIRTSHILAMLLATHSVAALPQPEYLGIRLH